MIMNIILFSIISIACGFFGAFAGAEHTAKEWRRILIPMILTFIAFISFWKWWMIFLMTLSAWLSMGYGIPDDFDEGSALGRFWLNITNNTKLANICTRGSIGLGESITLFLIPIIKHNWIIYIFSSISIIIINATISWRDLGMFTIKNKKLLWSEFIIYFALACFYLITILF